MFITILLFLALLSILVFVHELGHFVTAKRLGMKVEEFGFGFPPRLFGVKRGETVYSINAIPLGGFVKIKGENGNEDLDPDSFAAKPVWKRFVVLIAGVTMNFLLAVVLLSVGFMIGLPTLVDGSLSSSARVREQAVRIMSVVPQSPADQAGFKPGDTLVSINDQSFTSADAARLDIQSLSDPIVFRLDREGKTVTQTVTPALIPELGKTGIGIGLVDTALVSYPWYIAIGQGFMASVNILVDIFRTFGSIIYNLAVQHRAGVELSGPVGIAVMTGQVAALGFVYLLQFAALLSLNLAVVNVLPFPALDGGRILFLIVEKVRRGRALRAQTEAVVHGIGFMLLMGIILLVTFQDIMRFGGQFIHSIKGWFGA